MQASTPHLDALAGRGVLFANATVQAPLTLPSHASIMTGKYPPVHGFRDMEGFALDKSHATLASLARAGGFATAAFLGSAVLAREFGLANGFDQYDDDMGGSATHNEPAMMTERRGAVVTDRALAWLRSNRQRRFFLWAHYFDPHAPYDPPEPYKRAYAQDPYSGEIGYTDEQVGRMLQGLEQLGLASNTMVAVLADHGESLGEHGEATHGVFLYDATLHVPFLLAGPQVPRGKVVHEQVRSIDALPTLLAYAGMASAPGIQGVNLRPLIESGGSGNAAYSYSETLYPRTYMGWSELAAMRSKGWKLIVAPRPELYDLSKDPGESHNLITAYPAEADQLRKKITELEQVRPPTVAPNPTDSRTRRQLESLGYVSGGTSRHAQLGTSAPDPKDRVQVLDLLTQAEVLLNRKQYPQVTRLMEQALRLDPTNPRCHLSLAMAYEQMGQYPRAIDVFQHALRLKIETDKIYSRLGIDYLRLGQLEKAVEAMEQASAINPAELNNLHNLGMAYFQLGRVDDAERVFRAMVARDERYAAAHNGLGLVAMQKGQPEAARRAFERAVEVDPEEVKSVLDLGILYQETGNREQAIHYLEKFISKAPSGPFAPQIPAVKAAIAELKATRK